MVIDERRPGLPGPGKHGLQPPGMLGMAQRRVMTLPRGAVKNAHFHEPDRIALRRGNTSGIASKFLYANEFNCA